MLASLMPAWMQQSGVLTPVLVSLVVGALSYVVYQLWAEGGDRDSDKKRDAPRGDAKAAPHTPDSAEETDIRVVHPKDTRDSEEHGGAGDAPTHDAADGAAWEPPRDAAHTDPGDAAVPVTAPNDSPEAAVATPAAVAEPAVARMPERKRAARRAHIAREIVSTEKTYLAALDTIERVYVQPLAPGGAHAGLLSEAERHRVFSAGNLAVVRQIASLLCPRVDERVAAWDERTLLGDIFVELGDAFKGYVAYLNVYTASMTALNTARKRDRVAAFLNEARAACNGLDLSSLLIMPVQRIPRYELLLKDLLKHTPPTHADHANLAQAVAKISVVAAYCNEKKREAEGVQQVLAVRDRLANVSRVPELVTPTRRCVREGELRVRNLLKHERTHKRALLVLFNDALLYATRDVLKRWTARSLTPLLDVAVQPRDDGNGFVLVLADKKYEVLTAGAKECDAWAGDVRAAVQGSVDTVSSLSKRHVVGVSE